MEQPFELRDKSASKSWQGQCFFKAFQRRNRSNHRTNFVKTAVSLASRKDRTHQDCQTINRDLSSYTKVHTMHRYIFMKWLKRKMIPEGAWHFRRIKPSQSLRKCPMYSGWRPYQSATCNSYITLSTVAEMFCEFFVHSFDVHPIVFLEDMLTLSGRSSHLGHLG